MPRLRVPSLKVRQNAENVTPGVSSSKRSRAGRPRGSASRRGGRKPKNKNAPWEEEEDIEQHYGYESHSEEEDDDDFEVADLEQPEVSEEEAIESESELGEVIKTETDTDFICPWVDEDSNLPPLDLPDSSADIPLHPDLIMDMIELYEILRSYNRTLRLTPFSFEDFCAAMNSPDNSCLLSEIHLALLKICLKSDDEDQIHYSVNDTNNAFNIMVYSLDSMTYAEVLRQYLESDRSRLRVPIEILKAVNEPNYPFVDITVRIAVIAFLCYRFLDSSEYRKVVNNAGRFLNDDVCRSCGKGGTLQWCNNCEASFHVQCIGLAEKEDEWSCEICRLNDIRGVTDSIPFDQVRSKQPLRMVPLGRDRHGRIYWFVIRRIIIQDENESELYYYSTLPQIYELFSKMDPHFLEYSLCKTFCEQLQEIVEQMAISLEINNERFESISSREVYRDNALTCYLHLDNVNRMKMILNTLWNVKKEIKEEDENSYQPLPDRLLPLLGIMDNHLTNSFWSGHYLEADVVKIDVTPFLEQKQYFVMGCIKHDDLYKKYRNHYNGHEYADHPAYRKKIQDKKKYLSTRFSIIDEGDGLFSWSVARGRDMYGNDRLQAKYIEWTLARMGKKIPVEMMHQRWGGEVNHFRDSLAKADNYTALSKVLLMMECCMRRTIFHPQFWSSLGHTRLSRTTVDDRDLQSKELQKKKKEERDLTMGEDDDETIIKVKYTCLPTKACPQTLWRQRDEVYRVAGRGTLGGWMWVSKGHSRNIKPVPKYIETDDMEEAEKVSLKSKSARLDKLSQRLLKWRANEEISKKNRSKNTCYSPSCRVGIPLISVASSHFDPQQSCYSRDCRLSFKNNDAINPELFKDTNTSGVAKAFKKVNFTTRTPEKDEEVIWPLLKPNTFTYKSSKRKSILVIAQNILRKLARSGGRKAIYIPNFSVSAKSNMTLWNYPCSRPCFDLCWRYLVTNARSLHAVALQLKILWFCIKWAEFEPNEEETDAGRLIVHQMDRDDIRCIIKHQELPPHGTYERYLLEIEALMLEDDIHDEDDDYTDRSDRRASRNARAKRTSMRTATRRVKETTKQWIDGVELRVFEIRKYWEKVLKNRANQNETVKPSFSWEKIPAQYPVSRYTTNIRQPVGYIQRPPYGTPAVQNSRLPLAQLQMERRKRQVIPPRSNDFAYDESDFQDLDDDLKPSVAKRARVVFTTHDTPASPNRRTSNGFEYSGGMIRGGGRMVGQPVGDGMRRVAISGGGVPTQLGAEEVVSSSGQPGNARVVRAAGGAGTIDDNPPTIQRFDSQGGGYGAPIVNRSQPRQVVYSQTPLQRQAPNGKVLMIRRSDGSTQYLRPVTKEGEVPIAPPGTLIRTVVNQANPSTSADQSVMGGTGQLQRRIITTARPVRNTMVRPVEGPTKVLRIGQNGQQVVSSAQPRVVSRVEHNDEQYIKRVPAEKTVPGAPAVMSVQQNMQLVRRPARPVPIRTDQVFYGDDPSMDDYNQITDPSLRPAGRNPSRIPSSYAYGRPVQRIISRNSTGGPVGPVVQASSNDVHDDDGLGYGEEFVVDGDYVGDFEPALEQ